MSFLQNEWKSNATPDGNNGILSCLRSVVRGKSNKCVTIEPLHSCAKGTLQTLSYFLCTYIAHTFLETQRPSKHQHNVAKVCYLNIQAVIELMLISRFYLPGPIVCHLPPASLSFIQCTIVLSIMLYKSYETAPKKNTLGNH